MAVHAEIMAALAELMLKKRDSTNLIYRAAKLDFLLIKPNDPELISHTMESVKGCCNLLQDQFEMPPL